MAIDTGNSGRAFEPRQSDSTVLTTIRHTTSDIDNLAQ